jgi:MFS family permease
MYLSAAPLATCFAGALAYGITSGHPHGISSWRLLFLVEGLPVFVAAAIAWFFIPDSPEKARFLTEEELVVARARVVRQVGNEEAVKVHRINWTEVWGAMCDLKVCEYTWISVYD